MIFHSGKNTTGIIDRKFASWLLSGLVFLLGASLTGLMWRLETQHNTEHLRSAFEQAADRIANNIQGRIASYEIVMRGVKGFFEGSEHITADEFRSYVNALRLQEKKSGVQGIGLVVMVPNAQKQQHITDIRKQGFTDYRIKPAGERDHYAPIILIEPLQDENLKALGFDTLTVPAAREAMELSRDSGDVVITSRIALVQDEGRASSSSFVMYLPIYRDNVNLETVNDRRAAIMGWVDVPFRIKDFIAGMSGEFDNDIGFEIHDGEPRSELSIMYRSDGISHRQRIEEGSLQSNRRLAIGDREWTLLMATTPKFAENLSSPHNAIHVVLAGTALTLLLTSLTAFLSNHRYRERTRFKQLFDLAGEGVLVFTRDGSFIEANPAALEMLGYSHDELKKLRLPDIVKSNQYQRITTAIAQLMTGVRHQGEWQYLRKDASEFPAEVSVHILNGKRFIMICRDLTERKIAERRIDKLTRLYQALIETNQAIVRMDNENELFPLVCRCAVGLGGMKMAWIGCLNESSAEIQPAAAFGEGLDYLDNLVLSSSGELTEGQGPTGRALRENRIIIVNDYLKDPMTDHWLSQARKFGWASAAAFPIQRSGKPFAVLNVYHAQKDAFDDEAIDLLSELAIDISFALDNFDRETQRQLLTKELDNAYRRITRIIDVNPAIIYALKIKDNQLGDCIIDFVSSTVQRITGYAPEEWHTQGFWFQHIHDEDRPSILKAQQRLFEQGSLKHQYRFLHAEGHYIWVEDQLILRLGDDGRPSEIIGAWLDITEQKNTEEQLYRQARLLSESQAIAHVGSWIIDIESKHITWTDEAYRLFGLSPETNPIVTLDFFFELLYPDDLEAIQNWISSCSSGKKTVGMEFRTRPIVGKIRWLYATGGLETATNGDPIRMIGTVQDITERKATEQALRDNEARYRQLFAANPLPMWVYDIDTLAFLDVNDAAIAHYGYTREEFLGMTIDDIRPIKNLQDEQKELFSDHDSDSVIWRHRKKDGKLIWVEITGHTLNFQGRNAEIVLAYDISKRIAAEQQLRLHAQVYESSREGIVITDAENNIVSVNPAYTEISGYTPEEAVGKNPRFISSGQQDRMFYDLIWRDVLTKGHWQGEVTNRRKNGSLFPQLLSISVIRNRNGLITHHIGIMSDLTEHKAAEERIQFLSNFDSLTLLPNRDLLRDRTELAIASARRTNGNFALMFLDLDRFNIINDSLGPSTGDLLLKELSTRLIEQLHPDDTLCRQGGDEFIVLLPNTHTEGAAHVAQKILKLINQPFFVKDQRLSLTASIGIAEFPQDGANFEQLSQSADAALFRAKQNGRNNFQFFTRQLHEQANQLLQIENELRQALEQKELLLYFQPQIDAKTLKIVGAEALIRWRHPVKGMIPPGRFIPVAEESGLINEIGDWVIKTAIRQAADWQAQGLAIVPVAINISVVQFRQDSLFERIAQTLRENRIDPSMLELEMTEGIAMENSERTIGLLNRLHALGVSLSIDDFGTGYSSLSYLKRFKIDKLKIDQSFIRELSRDPEDEAIVSAIIGMAKSLSFKTIAEGVETRDQLEFLREKQCDEIQGYYFCKPIPANEFAELLSNRDVFANKFTE